VEYDYKSINDDLIEVLKNCNQKYKLEFEDTDYKISSSLSNGLSICNIKTNETVNLDSKPYSKIITGFNRYCNFSNSFKVNVEKSASGIILSKDFESKIIHRNQGEDAFHIYYVKDKKDVEKLRFANCDDPMFEPRGTFYSSNEPSSARYPTVIEDKSYSFSNDFSGRYGKIMYTESITLEDYGGEELWRQNKSSELIRAKNLLRFSIVFFRSYLGSLGAGVVALFVYIFLDADGDGVRNGIDECVKVPGPKSNNGCP
ncbi:hypothetical protein OAN33_05350, partial [Flavobacteriales bacterium]|nr:hypothetical protein [Flavobacteriales bacterium]